MLRLDSEVRYSVPDKKLTVWVRGEPVDDTVSIEPAYFPYRLEKLDGWWNCDPNPALRSMAQQYWLDHVTPNRCSWRYTVVWEFLYYDEDAPSTSFASGLPTSCLTSSSALRVEPRSARQPSPGTTA